MRKFLDRVHVYAKFDENQKGSGFFFVDLAWNDPYSLEHTHIVTIYSVVRCRHYILVVC